ncbi:MAG: oligosaccharide flippase family protein [Leptonema sp. (in: bacteria)]
MISVFKNLRQTNILKSGVLFISRSFHSLSSLIFSLVVGRLLTVEEHGLYSQYLARIVVLQAILEVGLQYSIIRYLTPFIVQNKESKVSHILRASLLIKLYSIIFCFFIILIWLLVSYLQSRWDLAIYLFPFEFFPEQLTNVWLVFLSAIGMSFFSYFDAILVSFKQYKYLTLWIPLTSLNRIILLLFFFFYNQGVLQLSHVLFSFMSGTFLSWPFYFLMFDIKKFLYPVYKTKVNYWIRKLLRYNSWIILASFFAILSDWMEILLLQNQSDTGIYNAARIPMQGIVILLSTMQSFIMPTMSTFSSSKEYWNYFKKIYMYIIILILILLPFGYFLEKVIPLWFGAEYYNSITVLRIIYPSFLLRIFFAPLGIALFTLDQPMAIAIESGLRMIAGLLLNLILIPNFGILGAAVSSLVSQFFGWIFLIILFFFYFKKNTFPDIVKIFQIHKSLKIW